MEKETGNTVTKNSLTFRLIRTTNRLLIASIFGSIFASIIASIFDSIFDSIFVFLFISVIYGTIFCHLPNDVIFFPIDRCRTSGPVLGSLFLPFIF